MIMTNPPAMPPLIPALTGYVSTGRTARCGRLTCICSIRLRDVTGTKETSSTGTMTCVSCGSTCANQPRHPASMNTAPNKDTNKLVTRPRATRVNPNARITGDAVGAGNWTVGSGLLTCARDSVIGSPAKDVNYGEDYKPHCVDKVPVEG